MADNNNLDTHGKASRMSLNRKAELLNCSKDGTFVMKFYEDGLAEKAEEYIRKDSPIDEHDVIVCNDIIAVCTNSIGRSAGLADELLSLFNHGNIENVAENDNFETLGDAYAKYPQSTLVMRKQYVDELNARIAQLEDDNALLKRNNENLRIDIKEIEKDATFESLSEQISKTIPPGHYTICVMPPQNLNSDIMVEKIMNALPDGTTIFKLVCT